MRLRASTVRKRSALLFHWDYRDGFTRRGVPVTTDGREGTFTRASVKTAVDSNGRVYTVPSGMPAINHRYSGGVWLPDGVLLERAATNVCLQSENFGVTWTLQGTPTRTAQAARCGTVYLDLIGDDSAAANEAYVQTVTFTSDAVKAISIYIRQGTSTTTEVLLNDSTAGVNRVRGFVTWNAGVPTVTMSTGTHLLSERLQDAAGNPVYRFWFQTTSVTAANTNQLSIWPARDAASTVTLTGTVYAGGVQAEETGAITTVPSSYIPTTTVAVTRAADFMEFPVLWLPRDLTIYVDSIELGTFQNSTLGARLILLGDNDSDTANLAMIRANTSTTQDVTCSSNTTGVGGAFSDLTSGGVALSDQHEIRFPVLSTVYTAGRSINGAAEVLGSTSAGAVAHPAAYAEAVLSMTGGSLGATFQGAHAIRTVKVAIGERTMAQCRTDV